MANEATRLTHTGAQIDDAIDAVQDAAFIADDDGSGGIAVTDISLSGLTDTAIFNPSNGQALVYNSTSSKWENGNVSGGGGEANVIEVVKVNGTALTPDSDKAVDVTVPTESTVSGWGFTKNTGTYSKPSGGIPSSDLASAVQTSLGKADTALQSYTETDPTVPSWAKASSKPSYTASEVGAVPTSRTVNGKALSANISLTASDVGAVSSDGVVTIYSGSTAPSSSTGSDGDIYIQTS